MPLTRSICKVLCNYPTSTCTSYLKYRSIWCDKKTRSILNSNSTSGSNIPYNLLTKLFIIFSVLSISFRIRILLTIMARISCWIYPSLSAICRNSITCNKCWILNLISIIVPYFCRAWIIIYIKYYNSWRIFNNMKSSILCYCSQ